MAHKAEVIKAHAPADGIVAVHARCCGDPSTDSVLTLHQLDRPEVEIDADIATHLARVEKLHADRGRGLQLVQRLTKK